MQKRKIKKIQISKSTRQKVRAKKQTKPSYILYKNGVEHQSIFAKLQKQTLILVPEVHLIEEVFELLTDGQKNKTTVWHSSLSTKEKFERWLQIQSGEKDIIIGTRASTFLPFSHLKRIIVDYEYDENHKHWDQNPRFHDHDVAILLAEQRGAALTYTSFSPSVESYFHIHKKNYSIPKKSSFELRTVNCELVDMANERKARNYDLLSDKVKDALLSSKEDVFLFINRKGYATSVGCNDCGHKELCPTCKLPLVYHSATRTLHCHYCHRSKPMSLTCPRCHSTMVELRGVGTEQVETLLRKTLGQNTHDIVRIDSESDHVPPADKPRIIIGTEMAFPHIHWDKTECVVFLDIDKQLSIPEYLAGERVWHLIQEVEYRKTDLSTFFIQTFNPSQLVLRSLSEPDRFYRTDLNLRRSLGYPPYSFIARYFSGHTEIAVAKKQAERLHSLLKEKLTKTKKSIILMNPVEMHPTFYRGKNWYMILVKFDQRRWQEDLPWVNSFVPRSWKIDPNPISILSP